MAMARVARRGALFLHRGPLPSCTRAASTKPAKAGGKDAKDANPKKPVGTGMLKAHSGTQNLFDVLASLPNWGIGMNVAKKSWRKDRFFTLTRINLYKSGNHGKAWGIFNENGAVKSDTILRMGGVHKRNWIVLEKPPAVPIPWKTISDVEPERVAKKKIAREKKAAKLKAMQAAAAAAESAESAGSAGSAGSAEAKEEASETESKQPEVTA